MAVKTINEMKEMLKQLTERLGESSTTDENLSLIEDTTDTLEDYERRLKESGDWERRYKENDAEWRTRYRDRFFSADPEDYSDVTEETIETEKKNFEDLFVKEEK